MSNAHAPLAQKLTYDFTNPALLDRALTHRSKSGENYERLEFLGDSILGFIVSSELYDRYPELTEGELTRLRASLVRKQTLARVARELDLGSYLGLGSGELKSGGFDRDSILADALEAVFGAIFKDGGIEPARRVILMLYAGDLEALDPHAVPKDPKTQLQEYLQQHALPTPVYNVVQVTGEPHQQHFVVECQVPGLSRPTRGEGGSRRSAEQEAASDALKRLTAGGP